MVLNMNLSVGIALVGVFQAFGVAIIGGLFNSHSTRHRKEMEKTEARAILRAEEGLLAMKLISASVNLGIATAHAIKDGKTNGTMESALREAEQAGESYQDFVKTVAARQIAKA